MEYQKLRTDNLLLKGKSKDFIKFCKIKPYRNSFYLSFGISLFESLIRSKKSIITQASINNLTQFTRRILPYFEQQRSFLTEISNILNTLNEQDYKTALELIDLYMTQNNGKEPEVMDKIMRVLMMASSNLNFSLLDVET